MDTKCLILVIFFNCLSLTISSAQADSVICEEEVDEMIFINPETAPIFANDTFKSDNKLMNYIYANLRVNTRLPNSIPIQMIVVQFTVTKEGKVKDVYFPRGARLADETNIREMLLTMPVWTPGKMNETLIDMKVTLPIRLELQE